MKKQMRVSLFSAVVGCLLFGSFLISATDNTAASTANHHQSAMLPAPAFAAPQLPGIPFTFFYTLVTSFTDGGSIDMDLVGEDGQSPIWQKPEGWDRKD